MTFRFSILFTPRLWAQILLVQLYGLLYGFVLVTMIVIFFNLVRCLVHESRLESNFV